MKWQNILIGVVIVILAVMTLLWYKQRNGTASPSVAAFPDSLVGMTVEEATAAAQAKGYSVITDQGAQTITSDKIVMLTTKPRPIPYVGREVTKATISQITPR